MERNTLLSRDSFKPCFSNEKIKLYSSLTKIFYSTEKTERNSFRKKKLRQFSMNLINETSLFRWKFCTIRRNLNRFSRKQKVNTRSQRLLKANRTQKIYIFAIWNFISFRLLFHNFVPISPAVNITVGGIWVEG